MAKNRYRVDNTFYISDLRLLVFVIGYARMGESIVLLMMNKDKCYYSAVIDSYQYRRERRGPFINKAVDILEEYHVERIDLLCWTHPHDDHSKGITTVLKKYCDEETNVLYPMYMENNEADIVKLKKVSREAVHKVLADNRAGKYKANPIGVIEGHYNNVDEFEVVNPFDEDEVRKVNIDVTTPISNKLTSYVNEATCSDPNELSITLILDIDGYGFYFGGDTTNEHIEASNKPRMSKCRFVKIPHHASKTADRLLKYLPVDELDAVCTTVFKWGRSKLPDKEVVKAYQRYFPHVYTTNKEMRKSGYGIIEYDYDFSTGAPVCTVHKMGNVGRMEMML